MERETWRRVQEIFLRVCVLPPDECLAAARRACGDDADLLAEVESLLEQHLPPNAPPPGGDERGVTGSLMDPLEPHPVAPAAIGPYEILHELDRGGMGVVYLARRAGDAFRRQVALKVLKRGMDTAQVLRRFELERQVLAALNHPGIARLYDGGERPDGTPYFVMEYVQGEPIDYYCDTHRLRVRERLELFRQVCRAVHYAHQNLVVHRDLKPGNILVTSDGDVKLLDFGIAKLINPQMSAADGVPTAPGMRVMTPEYASPEQVRGDTISTASDVYSLGVLLYELVSGHRPYRLASRARAEMERVICEEDPEKPSTAISRVETAAAAGEGEPGPSTRPITPESVGRDRESRPERLQRELAGDIDNIVLMAMRKEPQRRYASAEQFAEDLRRHLEGRPVIARPNEPLYRLRKFVGRNRAGVAVAVLIAMLLIGGIVTTTTLWQAVRAERDLARQRFDQVRELANTFMFDFHDEIKKLDGSLPARQLVLEKALEYLDGLATEGNVVAEDPVLARDIATAHHRVGELIGGKGDKSLGDPDAALEQYRFALDIRERLAVVDDDLDLQLDLARSHYAVGDMHFSKRDMDAALTSFRTMLTIAETVATARPEDTNAKRLVAMALLNIGAALGRTGDWAGALEHCGRSLVLRRERAAADPGDDGARQDLAVAHIRVGYALGKEGRLEESLAVYEEAVRIRERRVEDRPDDDEARQDLANAIYYLLGAHVALDDPEPVLERAASMIALAEENVRDNPRDPDAKFTLGIRHHLVGYAHLILEDWTTARSHFEPFLELVEGLSIARAGQKKYREQVGVAHERLAEVAAGSGDLEAAIREQREALVVYESLVALSSKDATSSGLRAGARVSLAGYLHDRATASFDAGDRSRAIAATVEAIELLDGETDPEAAALRETLGANLACYRETGE